MSFIQEQRESALEENTAQRDLLDYLENLLPTITEIDIKIPLTGDLDFNILKECNFNNITSITLSPGKITSIQNIPEGITYISCPKNLLIQIDNNLPSSLIDLNVSYNGLKQIDFSNLPNLKNLTLNNNQIVEFENLPSTLETLYCNNNLLKRIDLEGVSSLKVLHCSYNNPALIIEHVPDTITDLKSDHSPLIDIQREDDEEKDRDNFAGSGPEFSESLDKYFELKKQYEEKVRTMKQNIYKKAISKKAAKASIKMVRPPCIQCSRPVGTVFSNKDRNYTALCGDTTKPCSLNIKIYAGKFDSINDEIVFLNYLVENVKENIIRLKMDALFNYTDEKKAAAKFKEEFENYNETNFLFGEVKRKYEELHFNDEKNDKIKAKEADIDKLKEDIARFLKEYSVTGNRLILEQALVKHIKELIPETNSGRYLKYGTMEVVESEPEKFRTLYTLFQKDVALNKLDFTFGEPPRVAKFVYK